MPNHGTSEYLHQISGGIFFNVVVQGQNVTVLMPPQITPALAGLPGASRSFTGRGAVLSEMLALLDPACHTAAPAVAVAGLAGVGKTELAVQAARHALRQGWFPGGVLFVDMLGNNASLAKPGAVAGRLLHALGIAREHIPAEGQDRLRLYQSVLAALADHGRRILVLLDNAASAEQVRPLLPADGINRAIVTSRQTLGLLDARLVDLGVLAEQDGITLLHEVLQVANGPGDTRVSEHRSDAAEISRLCGYLPLALRIVAALLADDPGLPLAALAADLAGEHARLDELAYGETAVRSAFDLSYQRLPQTLARLFLLLPVNPGPDIGTECAAVMASQTQRTTRRQLAELASAHLLERGPGRGRWRMHDLVRIYARDHAGDDDKPRADTGAQLLVLLNYYCARTDQAVNHLEAMLYGSISTGYSGREHLPVVYFGEDKADLLNTLSQGPVETRFRDHEQAVAWLVAERLNLIAAVNFAAKDQPVFAAVLALRLTTFLSWRRYFDDALHVARMAVDCFRRSDGPPEHEAHAASLLGQILAEMGRFQEAADAHRRDLALSKKAGDKAGQGRSYANLSTALFSVGQFDEADRARRQATTLFKRLRQPLAVAKMLNFDGVRLLRAGQFAAATVPLREALKIFQELSARQDEGMGWINLGDALMNSGSPQEAAEAWRRGAATFKHTCDRYYEGIALFELGAALKGLGRPGEAIEPLRQATEACDETNDQEHLGRALSLLGGTLTEMHRDKEAIEYLQRAVQAATEAGDRATEGLASNDLGRALTEEGRSDEAIGAQQRAARIFADLGIPEVEGLALDGLGLALLDSGRYQEALDALAQAHRRSTEAGNKHNQATALEKTSLALCAAGRFEDAIEAATRAVAGFQEIHLSGGEASALNHLGNALRLSGRLHESLEAHQKALAIFREMGDKWNEASAMININLTLDLMGKDRDQIER
jgi:tetratricopeptide (TPR) repeat protein